MRLLETYLPGSYYHPTLSYTPLCVWARRRNDRLTVLEAGPLVALQGEPGPGPLRPKRDLLRSEDS